MIEELLRSLRLYGALAALVKVEEIAEKKSFVVALLQAELELRHSRATRRRLLQAKFPLEKEWCDLDRNLNPQVDFAKVEALTNGKFIEKKENLCLMGQQGTGKTHSLIALGRGLCRQGISVRFYTASQLVHALEEAKSNQSLTKLMQSLMKPQLLIIDELGFVPFSENGARLLFEVFASRYERGSIAVSTNLSLEKWIQVFGTAELTAALIDRFSHRCLICTYQGQSVRLLAAKQKKEESTKGS